MGQAEACPNFARFRDDCLAALGGRVGHHGADLREDRRDRRGNVRHDGAGGNRDEAGHQRIFDEVLALRVLPDLQLQHEIFHSVPFFLLFPYLQQRFLTADTRLPSAVFNRN